MEKIYSGETTMEPTEAVIHGRSGVTGLNLASMSAGLDAKFMQIALLDLSAPHLPLE